MSRDFADCYQSVTFGHDRGLQTIREESAKVAVQDLTDDIALELVRLVFASATKTEKIDIFKKFFKDKDPTFKATGNDQEILALAGWVLAEICSTRLSSPVTTAILTSAACGAKKPILEMDLVGIAQHEMVRDGDSERKRPEITLPTNFEKITLEDHLETEDAEESEPDLPDVKKALPTR